VRPPSACFLTIRLSAVSADISTVAMYVSRPSLIGMRHPRTRYRESENPSWFGHVGVEKVGGGTCPPNKPAPPEKCSARLALQSVSRRTASPPGRSFDGAAGWDSIYHVCRAARKDSDYLVGRATRTPVAGKAAGPDSGPCATRLDPDVRKAFRSRGTACRPLRVHCRRTRKGRASPTPTW